MLLDNIAFVIPSAGEESNERWLQVSREAALPPQATAPAASTRACAGPASPAKEPQGRSFGTPGGGGGPGRGGPRGDGAGAAAIPWQPLDAEER